MRVIIRFSLNRTAVVQDKTNATVDHFWMYSDRQPGLGVEPPD